MTVVIPCLNEAETIAQAVREALGGISRSNLRGEVVVADNGSTDGSQAIATNAGARIICVPLKGYGAALDAGIRSAAYEYVVFADADLSYPFAELPKLIAPLHDGRADFVLGSRLRGSIQKGAMPHLNRFMGTPVLSLLIRRLYSINTSDCNSGMRALLKRRYRDLDLRCPGMEYASEMLIRVSQRGLRYTEVPISFYKDQRNRAPHLKRWRDGWRHLRFILGNASSSSVVIFPAILSGVFLALPLVLSFRPFWAPNEPVRYHTAFILIAIAIPFLMFTLSSVLVKTVLHESGQVNSRLVSAIRNLGEDGKPFYLSVFLYGLVGLQSVYMLWEWYGRSWGEFSDISGVIRIVVLAVTAATLFSLDLALGILKLIPYQVTIDNEPPSTK